MRNHIKEILFALCDGGVEYIIGGGVAAVLYGVERVTLDIDIAVNMTTDNLDRLIGVIKALGMRPRVPVPLPFLKDPEIRRMMVEDKHALVFTLIDPDDALRYLDIFMTADLSYPSLIQDAEVIEVEGHFLRIIGRRRLLAIKKAIHPPRDKDYLDIRFLEKLLEDEKK